MRVGIKPLSALNICIAVVKENARRENRASEGGLSQNVGQTTLS